MTLAWCFEDETTPSLRALLDAMLQEEYDIVVPSLWPYEVANGLQMAVRRGRISVKQSHTLLALVTELPVELIELHAGLLFGMIFELAVQERLTVYDASYLFLAVQEKLPLLSLDRSLSAAARRHGVDVLH
jgi:predicted nucleic acid-binding protein